MEDGKVKKDDGRRNAKKRKERDAGGNSGKRKLLWHVRGKSQMGEELVGRGSFCGM